MHKNNNPSFRPDIEGLRAIAVLLVVAYHAKVPGISGGFIGVDVFFVISGYVISSLIVSEIRKTGSFNFISFYAGRARRLIPASTLTILTTVALSTVLLSPFEIKEIPKAAFAGLLFGSNIWFLIQSSDYFAPAAAKNPLLHTWSLGVEEQFYLFWPVLIFFLAWRTAPAWRQVAILGMISAASLAVCVSLTSYAQPVAFFSMPTRAWQFGAGALAFLLPGFPRGLTNSLPIAGWLGFITIIAAAVTITSDSFFPGVIALAPTIGAVLILLSGKVPSAKGVLWLLSTSPMQTIGGLSYSWYLWHWPALVLAGAVFSEQQRVRIIGVVLGSLAVAAVTHHYVENPIRFNRFLSQRSLVSLAFAVMLVLTSVVLAYGGYFWSKKELNTPRQRDIAAAAEVKQRYRDCQVEMEDGPNELKECVLGDRMSTKIMVLFGDSHAWQWLPALEDVAHAKGYRLINLTRSACPVASVPYFNSVLKRDYWECESWRAKALRRIGELRPSLVVVGTSYGYLQGRAITLDRWQSGIRETFERLHAESARIAMIRDNPVAEYDIPVCLSRADWRRSPAGSCAFPRGPALRSWFFDTTVDAIRGIRDVTIIDFSDEICGTETCNPEKDNTIIYRDNNHLTDAYVRMLAPMLEQKLFPELGAHSDPGPVEIHQVSPTKH